MNCENDEKWLMSCCTRIALDNAGRKCLITEETPGVDVMENVLDAFDECKVAIIFGTESYGERGDATFSSKEELEFIMKEEMPFFLIKRCKNFKDPLAKSYLLDAPHMNWPLKSKMPKKLVNTILEYINDLETLTTRPDNGFGRFVFANGTKYAGMWVHGQPNGVGRQEYFDGSVFEGTFVNGQREGLGKYTYGEGTNTPGDVYEGNYVAGTREGEGKYLYKSNGKAGERYIGSWKDNLFDGYGSYFYTNGEKYDGMWKAGKMNGTGIYTYAGERTGDVYHGEFKDGRKDGHGEFTYANGDHYIGAFKDDMKHGKGTYLYEESGNKYVGVYAFDQQNGIGEMFYGPGSGKHGDSFRGEFKNGVREGNGLYRPRVGTVKEGVWRDDKFVEA